MPRASVIMTSYNTPKDYLKEAIESILKQSYDDFEFIIIDDCSKESIEDFVKSYNDPRIKFIRNQVNMGVNQAPNVGLKEAQGDYIFRMDSDDIAYPQRLEKQIKYLDEHPEIDVLGTAFEMFPKKRIVKYPSKNDEIKYTMRFMHNAICNPSVAIRKSAIDKNNIKYNKKNTVCEDYGLWLEYIDVLNFANLDEVLLNYRWHKNNISKKKTDIQSTGSERLMIEAQGKYLNIDSSEALLAVDKFAQGKVITSCDLEALNDFITKAKSSPKVDKYQVNRHFYKSFLKKCTRDINFVKILFSKELSEIIKLDTPFKILTLFGL